jgi:hypothetical protein
MRKVTPVKLEFEYEESKDNEEIVQDMYNKIFNQAKQNILSKRNIERKEVDKKITNDEKIHNLCESISSRPV